jgi:hypothetical protein
MTFPTALVFGRISRKIRQRFPFKGDDGLKNGFSGTSKRDGYQIARGAGLMSR